MADKSYYPIKRTRVSGSDNKMYEIRHYEPESGIKPDIAVQGKSGKWEAVQPNSDAYFAGTENATQFKERLIKSLMPMEDNPNMIKVSHTVHMAKDQIKKNK